MSIDIVSHLSIDIYRSWPIDMIPFLSINLHIFLSFLLFFIEVNRCLLSSFGVGLFFLMRSVVVKNGHGKVNIQISVKINMNVFTKSIFRKRSLLQKVLRWNIALILVHSSELKNKFMKNRRRYKQGRHVTTDPWTSRSLRSDRQSRPIGRYVATGKAVWSVTM